MKVPTRVVDLDKFAGSRWGRPAGSLRLAEERSNRRSELLEALHQHINPAVGQRAVRRIGQVAGSCGDPLLPPTVRGQPEGVSPSSRRPSLISRTRSA